MFVLVECEVTKVTEKAACIAYKYGPDLADVGEKWVPLSLCEAPDTISVGDEEITVEKWYADREGLPY